MSLFFDTNKLKKAVLFINNRSKKNPDFHRDFFLIIKVI
jgi:hypothetical protein